MMIGETAPTGPLNVATSWLSVTIAPGAAPPDQLAPVLHNPSLPPPVHGWLAAMTLVAVIADTIAASVEIAFARGRRACSFFIRSILDCIDALRYGLMRE